MVLLVEGLHQEGEVHQEEEVLQGEEVHQIRVALLEEVPQLEVEGVVHLAVMHHQLAAGEDHQPVAEEAQPHEEDHQAAVALLEVEEALLPSKNHRLRKQMRLVLMIRIKMHHQA